MWGAEEVETFDSVTTILNAVLAKPALPNWAARTCGEYVADHMNLLYRAWKDDPGSVVSLVKNAPWKVRNDAADRGTLVHALAETAANGVRPAVPDHLLGYFEAWQSWVDECGVTFEETEATVFSRAGRYAGTFDALVNCRLGLVMVDYKSGSGVYPEASLQLTAYRYAEFIGLPDGTEVPMPEIDGTYVLHLTDGDYDFVPVLSDQAQLDAWNAVRYLHDWTKRDDVIGASVGGVGAW